MGYHATYADNSMTDDDILKYCKERGLILLTRDISLSGRSEKSVLIESPHIRDQLMQFLRIYGVNREKLMKICPVCDGSLEEVDKDLVQGDLPRGVLRENEEFWKCDRCGKFYWHGTHYRRITDEIERLVGAANEDEKR